MQGVHGVPTAPPRAAATQWSVVLYVSICAPQDHHHHHHALFVMELDVDEGEGGGGG